MREKRFALIITILLLITFPLTIIISTFLTDFTFDKSTLTISEEKIIEYLEYKPNKDFHTLYRNFNSIVSYNTNKVNTIIPEKVLCSEGTAYFYTSDENCYYYENTITNSDCLPYTEPNEYGCTFGNIYGFNKGSKYTIKAEYSLNPRNLFQINNKNYIKFVAYSKKNHPILSKSSFIINGEHEKKDFYFPNENAIIYIPYTKDPENKTVIRLDDFEYDNKNSMLFILLLISFIPAAIFYFTWRFFGKELTFEDIPEQLSFIPNYRKPWQVATYFNPPFSTIDKNFFASTLLDFYKRKIINIKVIKKQTYLKLNNYSEDLDKIETKFLEIIELIVNKCPKKHMDKGYVNLKKASSGFFIKFSLQKLAKELQKQIKKEGKEFVSLSGIQVLLALEFLTFFIILFLSNQIIGIQPYYIFVFILIFFLTIILSSTSALMIRFKKNYYIEYQKWNSFRRWLKYSPSMKTSKSKAVILWEDYLIYATSLGIAKKVLKELKKQHIISEQQYNFYNSVHISSNSFATSSGTSSGGVSGGAGGGVGGGGGGGR